MKSHNFKPVGHACGTGAYYCADCGSSRLDNDPPHHFPSWRYVSHDCDEAKKQVVEYMKDYEARSKALAVKK